MRRNVERVDRPRDRRDRKLREQRAEPAAGNPADDPVQRALRKEYGADRAPARAQRPQRPDLGAALDDRDCDRIVDEIHPDQQRDVRERGEVELKRAQHAADLTGAYGGRDRARSRREQPANRRGRRRQACGIDDAVDAIEYADLAEEILSGRDVDEHDARIEPGRPRRYDSGDAQPLGARTRLGLEDAAGVPTVRRGHAGADERAAPVDDQPRIAGRHVPGGDDPAFASRNRTQQIDAQDAQDLARLGIPGARTDGDRIFDDGARIAHAGDGGNAQQRAFVEAAADTENLQVDVIGDHVDAARERRDRRAVGERDRERDRDPERNGDRGHRGAQPVGTEMPPDERAKQRAHAGLIR